MRAVLGIGNPGAKYVLTKHNAGFIIIDTLVEQLNLNYTPSKGDYYYAEGKLKDSEYIVIKPTTYVNNSGLAARDVLDNYDIAVEDFLVVVDDIALPIGNLRARISGGSGGHNGLESLIYHLESENFPRIRFGIGSRFEDGFQADYVLSKFSENEFKDLKPNFEICSELTKKFFIGGQKLMMDHFSRFANEINKTTPPQEREEN